MLSQAPIRAYIPVSNVARARTFYEGTLGLRPKQEYAGGVIYACGGTEVFMYPTPNAGTSKASQAFWQVADVEKEVAELKARGVTFEHYDMPGINTRRHRDRRRREDGLVQGHGGEHPRREPAAVRGPSCLE